MRADFNLSNGILTLVVSNLQQTPTADTQMISGISFNVGGATGSGSLTTVNQGNISTIQSGGAYSAGVSDALTRWKATESGTSINLNLFYRRAARPADHRAR